MSINAKNDFIHSVVFSNTIQGAFQRIRIYPQNLSEDKRVWFRLQVGLLLKDIAKNYTEETVGSKEHILNIEKLLKESGVPTFGVAQKLLNLYLKYLWCLGKVNIPPHCPVDSKVILKVSEILKDKSFNNYRWSRIDKKDYEYIVQQIQQAIKKEGFEKIAEWEIEVFNKLNPYISL